MRERTERERAYFKAYYLAHRDKIRAKAAMYYLKNKDRINAKSKRRLLTLHGRIQSLMYKFKCSYDEAAYWISIKSCQICGGSLAVATNHDHTSGIIRGRLCYKCNRAIGALGDTTERLKAAVRYLETVDERRSTIGH